MCTGSNRCQVGQSVTAAPSTGIREIASQLRIDRRVIG